MSCCLSLGRRLIPLKKNMIEKKNTREQLEKLDIDNSSKIQHFFYSIKVDSFRHLNNLPEITFQYPVTVLSGGNKS